MERITPSRLVRRASVKEAFQTIKTKHSFLHRSIFIYNKLEVNIRTQPIKKFNKTINKYITNTYGNKNIPKIP